jgi:diaminopimelate decarboxylase
LRSDLPRAVSTAIDSRDRPALVFDLPTIERNAKSIAEAARASSITTLFAAKSFPHPEVRNRVARIFDGFDAASAAELAELPPARILSIADPTGRTAATAQSTAQRVIVSCETVDQIRAAPAHAEIAIRISASLTGRDPAIGVIQDGTGHRRSRFGLDVEPARRAAAIRELLGAAAGRPVGLHVHHGPVTATAGERFIATARAVLASAAEAELSPRFINLGGAWHGLVDLEAALREVRAAVPREIELIIEPGRALGEDAGFACGRVVVARELDDRSLRVTDLSRICHLRWSQLELVGVAPRPGMGRKVVLVGPTCFEDDVLGEWVVEDELAAGARVIVRHVTGYAVAWNTGFHGVPPADVVVV